MNKIYRFLLRVGVFQKSRIKILSCLGNAPKPEPSSTGQAGKVSFAEVLSFEAVL
jgi:hypothetical protein